MAGRGRNRRAPLQGWVKWIPLLFLPAGLLFVEAYLRMERTRNDYEINIINQELERVTTHVDELKSRKAAYDNMDFLDAKAKELRLVKPAPGQIETLETAGGAPPELPNIDLGLPLPEAPEQP